MKNIGRIWLKAMLVSMLPSIPSYAELAGSVATAPMAAAADTAFLDVFSSLDAAVLGAKTTANTLRSNPATAQAAPAKDAEAAAIQALTADATACQSAAKYAKICLTDLSEDIQTAAGVIGVMLTTISNTKNVSTAEVCKKQKSAVETAKKALTLYNAACSIAQAKCASACEGLAAKLKAAQTKYPGPTLTKANLSAEPQTKVCQGYKWNMAAAGMGIFSMLAEAGNSTQCEAATTVADCKANLYDPSCATKMDCSKQENYQQTACICQRNPNSAGCAGYAGNSINMPAGTTNVSTGTSPDGANLNLGTVDNGIPVAGVSSATGKGSSSLGGASGAGGGNGFGVGGAGAKTGGADGLKKDKALNPNVLGGYDGGGGGGGGASRSSASLPDSPYKDYLPGGKNDPKASTKVFGNGQVTASGSKSNWEKVSERYTDAKPTLVGP